MATEEVFVEKNPRPSVLVVEDNIPFAEMAMNGLKGSHDVSLAPTLVEVIYKMGSRKFDFILSDVMFPVEKGHEEIDNSKAMLKIALNKAIPIAFVTGGDHHGMITGLMDTEESRIVIKCLSLSDIYNSLLNISHNKDQKKTDFNNIVASYSKIITAAAKEQSIWSYALNNLKNVSAKPNPISASMRKVSDLFGGKVGFEMREGMPFLTDSKIKL